MEIEINNQSQEDNNLEGVIKQTLKEASVFIKKRKKISQACEIKLSVAFLDKNEMAKINLTYRNINKPTDVLSFCYKKNKEEMNGEILLCLDVIKKNAEKERIDSKKELENNLIHGLLHMSGFNHSQEMSEFQDEILKLL